MLHQTQVKASRRLDYIADEHRNAIKRMKELMEENIKDVRRDLATHLNSKAVEEAAACWGHEDLPQLLPTDTWYEFEAKILHAVQGQTSCSHFSGGRRKPPSCPVLKQS